MKLPPIVLALVVAASPTSAQTETVENTSEEDLCLACSHGNCNDGGVYRPVIKSFTINGSFEVADVNFGLVIDYILRNQLRALLISPSGQSVELLGGDGGSLFHFDVMLDSESSNPLNDGDHDNAANPPYYERLAAPTNSLDAFVGGSSDGNWRVELCGVDGGGRFYRALLQVSGPEILIADFEENDFSEWTSCEGCA